MVVKYVRENWHKLPHPLRWVVAATVGSTLLVLGLVFMLIPGPGTLLFVLGLAILATEFAWARVVLERIQRQGAAFSADLRRRWRGWRGRAEQPELPLDEA